MVSFIDSKKMWRYLFFNIDFSQISEADSLCYIDAISDEMRVRLHIQKQGSISYFFLELLQDFLSQSVFSPIFSEDQRHFGQRASEVIEGPFH